MRVRGGGSFCFSGPQSLSLSSGVTIAALVVGEGSSVMGVNMRGLGSLGCDWTLAPDH